MSGVGKQLNFESDPAELAKRCFWILTIESFNKTKRVSLASEKIKTILEQPEGERFKKFIEDDFFKPLTKREKHSGMLIRRFNQIHKFCFSVIETEARRSVLS